jgi:hypothetical protein
MRCQLSKRSGEGWGLEYAITMTKKIIVLGIASSSPSSFSQLREGDILNSINGNILAGLTRKQTDEILNTTNYLDIEFTRDGLGTNGTNSSSTAVPVPSTTTHNVITLIDDESSDSRDGFRNFRSPSGYSDDNSDQGSFSDDESIGATDSDGVINLISDDEMQLPPPPSPPLVLYPPIESTPIEQAQPSPAPLSPSMMSSSSPVTASVDTPLPVHSPPVGSPSPQRKRTRTTPSTPGITLKFEPVGFGCADVGDEVVEVPNPHKMAEQPQFVDIDLDDDAVEVMGGHVTNAGDMPHPRESCPNFRFVMTTIASASSSANNMNFCPQCYCFVCEVKASECVDWTSHCDATRKLSTWRAKKTTLASPFMLLLHPSKRAHMYQLAQRIHGLDSEELASHISRAKALLKTVTTATDLNTQQISYSEAFFLLWICLKRSITDGGNSESKKNGTSCLLSLGVALLLTRSLTAPYVPKNLCPALTEELGALSRSLVARSFFATSAMEVLPVLISLASDRRTNPNWIFEPSGRSDFPTGLNLNAETSTLVYKVLKEVGACQITILEFVSLYNQTLFASCFSDLLRDLNLQSLNQFICHILDRKSNFSFDVLRTRSQSQLLTCRHIFLLYALLLRTESEFSSKQRKFQLLESLSKVAVAYFEDMNASDLTNIRTLFTRDGYEERTQTDSLLQLPQLKSAQAVTLMDPAEIISKYSEYTSDLMVTDIFFSFLYSFLEDWSSSFSLYAEFDPPNSPQLNFLSSLFEISNHGIVAMYFLHFGLLYFESSSSDKFFYLLSGVGLQYIRDFRPNSTMSPSEFIYSFPTQFINRWSRPVTLKVPHVPAAWSPSESLFCGVCRPADYHLRFLIDKILVGDEVNEPLAHTFFKITWNVFLDLSQRTIKEYSDRGGALCSIISVLRSSQFSSYANVVCPELSKLDFEKEPAEMKLNTLREFKSMAKSRGEIVIQGLPSSPNLWGLWQRVLPVLFMFDFIRKLIIEDFEPIRKGGRAFLQSLRGLKANDLDLQNETIPEIIWSTILEQHQRNPTDTLRILDDLASQKTPSILHDLIFYSPPRFANMIVSSRSPSLVFFVRDTERAVLQDTHPSHCFHSQISALWTEISTKFVQMIDADITRTVYISGSGPEDQTRLENSFLVSIAIRLPYALKRLSPLLFDKQNPNRSVISRAMKAATSVEDLLLILQYTIEYLRQWGRSSFISLTALPLYKELKAISDPLVTEVMAIVEPSLETVSNFFEKSNPSQAEVNSLNQHWVNSLTDSNYLKVCLKFLPVEMLETFLEKHNRLGPSGAIFPSGSLFREAVDSIAVCYQTNHVGKSYLLIQWLVALLLSRDWEDESETTAEFLHYLKSTEEKIIQSGLPLTVPSSASISFPSTKFGLTLFPHSSFKIFRFITHPSAQEYDDIIRLPLSEEIKLKLLNSTQREHALFIRICCSTRQFEHLFKRLAKMKSIVVMSIISILELEGFFNPSAFICSSQEIGLIQEFGFTVNQMITVSTLTNTNCLLPALRWIRRMYLLKYADQSSFLLFLAKFPLPVRENSLVSLLCNLWKGSIEIAPLVSHIHELLGNDLIQSATKKLGARNGFNPFEMVLDACCPEETQPNGLPRIKRFIRFLEFRASPASQCVIASCGCSRLSNPSIPMEILRDSLVDCVSEMLRPALIPSHSRSGLDLSRVSELMQTQLQPLYEVILSSERVSTSCLVLPLIACTKLPRFTSLIDYGVMSGSTDFFYPLFKLVFSRESRVFGHYEFLFQLPRRESITYANFAQAVASATFENMKDEWLGWFRSLYRQDMHPFRLKYLEFLMSFPKQSELNTTQKDLWLDIFNSVTTTSLTPMVLQPLLDLRGAYRSQWASHVKAIFEACPAIAQRGADLPTFITICRHLLEEEGIAAISTFLQQYCLSLVRDRVDAGRRLFFQSLLVSLKALFVEANQSSEWIRVSSICCRTLNSKKKVQEVMRAAMM